jgi:hypothetical protein
MYENTVTLSGFREGKENVMYINTKKFVVVGIKGNEPIPIIVDLPTAFTFACTEPQRYEGMGGVLALVIEEGKQPYSAFLSYTPYKAYIKSDIVDLNESEPVAGLEPEELTFIDVGEAQTLYIYRLERIELIANFIARLEEKKTKEASEPRMPVFSV